MLLTYKWTNKAFVPQSTRSNSLLSKDEKQFLQYFFILSVNASAYDKFYSKCNVTGLTLLCFSEGINDLLKLSVAFGLLIHGRHNIPLKLYFENSFAVIILVCCV